MSDTPTVKLRKPVSLKKGDQPVEELTLKLEGRALRGIRLSMGLKGDAADARGVEVFQRFGVHALAGAGLRMAGVPGDRVKLVLGELHEQDVMGLYWLVHGLLTSAGAPEADTEGGSVTIVLRRPVQFGKALEPVERITLEPTGGALRDLDLMVSSDADLPMFHADLFELAKVGMRMGRVHGDVAVLDLMHPADVMEVASTVLGFINGGPQAGSEASPS